MSKTIPTAATKALLATAARLETEAAALRAIAEGNAKHAPDETTPGDEKRTAPAVLHKGGPVGPLNGGIPTIGILHAARRATNSPGGYL